MEEENKKTITDIQTITNMKILHDKINNLEEIQLQVIKELLDIKRISKDILLTEIKDHLKKENNGYDHNTCEEEDKENSYSRSSLPHIPPKSCLLSPKNKELCIHRSVSFSQEIVRKNIESEKNSL